MTDETAPPPLRRRARWPWMVLTAVVLLAATGLWLAYDRNLIFKDSGIAACESMRAGDRTFAGRFKPDGKLTEAQYRDLRKVFADSRYDDIREHGTRLTDSLWQISQATGTGTRLPDAAALGTGMTALQQLLTHLNGLQSACADQGIIVNLTSR